MNIQLWKYLLRLLRYRWKFVQKIKKIEYDVFFLFKVIDQGSIELCPRSYKVYWVKVAELLMSFNTTNERTFCDKK